MPSAPARDAACCPSFPNTASASEMTCRNAKGQRAMSLKQPLLSNSPVHWDCSWQEGGLHMRQHCVWSVCPWSAGLICFSWMRNSNCSFLPHAACDKRFTREPH